MSGYLSDPCRSERGGEPDGDACAFCGVPVGPPSDNGHGDCPGPAPSRAELWRAYRLACAASARARASSHRATAREHRAGAQECVAGERYYVATDDAANEGYQRGRRDCLLDLAASYDALAAQADHLAATLTAEGAS